jgi:hypothetical protein
MTITVVAMPDPSRSPTGKIIIGPLSPPVTIRSASKTALPTRQRAKSHADQTLNPIGALVP